uniref:Uncharacterized protein n=1 Tax=Lepeophtheirus salmonis TaxID=72036 RepID=A0A0K2VBZ3_LEPSM
MISIFNNDNLTSFNSLCCRRCISRNLQDLFDPPPGIVPPLDRTLRNNVRLRSKRSDILPCSRSFDEPEAY